jgi:NitT/TauT family transport system substrate-binding protein
VPIGVGYHSGSHFATVQALENVLAPDDLKLSFQGPPNERLDALLGRQVPAATAWGVPLYIAEAFGFRKVIDATFMIGFLTTGFDVSKADVEKYLGALPYTREVFTATQHWTEAHNLFPEMAGSAIGYDEATL